VHVGYLGKEGGTEDAEEKLGRRYSTLLEGNAHAVAAASVAA
jgi:hypothetical protein